VAPALLSWASFSQGALRRSGAALSEPSPPSGSVPPKAGSRGRPAGPEHPDQATDSRHRHVRVQHHERV